MLSLFDLFFSAFSAISAVKRTAKTRGFLKCPSTSPPSSSCGARTGARRARSSTSWPARWGACGAWPRARGGASIPFSGPLDRWTVGEAVFSLADPNRLATLTELYETERFPGLRDKLPAFYGASCLTELVLALVPDLEPQPALFDLVLEGLRLLESSEPGACQAVTLAAVWRLLAMLGYVPPMNRCVQCETPVETSGPVDFSAGLGGVVCAACRPPAGTHRLTGKAVQAIAFLLEAPWDEVRRVRLTAATAAQLTVGPGSAGRGTRRPETFGPAVRLILARDSRWAP